MLRFKENSGGLQAILMRPLHQCAVEPHSAPEIERGGQQALEKTATCVTSRPKNDRLAGG